MGTNFDKQTEDFLNDLVIQIYDKLKSYIQNQNYGDYQNYEDVYTNTTSVICNIRQENNGIYATLSNTSDFVYFNPNFNNNTPFSMFLTLTELKKMKSVTLKRIIRRRLGVYFNASTIDKFDFDRY